MIMRIDLLVALSLSFCYSKASSNLCYFRADGLTPNTASFTPCFPSDPQTHCCDTGQTCLSNGLCFVKWDSSLNTGGCTDESWSSSACFPSCPGFSTIYRCNDNNWCCSPGGNTTSCCQDPNVNLFKIPDQAMVQNGTGFIPGYTFIAQSSISTSTTASSSSSTSSSSMTSNTASSTANTTASYNGSAPANYSTDSSSTNIAAIAAGVGVGLPLLAVIAVLSGILFREKKRNKDLQGHLSGFTQTFGRSDMKDRRTINPHQNFKPELPTDSARATSSIRQPAVHELPTRG